MWRDIRFRNKLFQHVRFLLGCQTKSMGWITRIEPAASRLKFLGLVKLQLDIQIILHFLSSWVVWSRIFTCKHIFREEILMNIIISK